MKLINGLAETGISEQYLSWKHRPHVTIGLWNDVDIRRCDKILEQISFATPIISVKLASIGVFNNTGSVFLAPVMTSQLDNLHKTIHNDFSFCDKKGWEYYLPNNWVPHCSVALNGQDNTENLVKATEYAIKNFYPIYNSTFVEMGIVEIIKPVNVIQLYKFNPSL